MRTVCFYFLPPLYFGHILSLCIFLNVFIVYLYFCHNWMQYFYCTLVYSGVLYSYWPSGCGLYSWKPYCSKKASEKRNCFHYSRPRCRACWTWLPLIKRSHCQTILGSFHGDELLFSHYCTLIWPSSINFGYLWRDLPWWGLNRGISQKETIAVASTPGSEDTFSRLSAFLQRG